MLQLNFHPFPVLHTERITLNEIRPEDAAELYRMRSNEKVREYVHIPVPASVEEMEAFIQKIRNSVQNNDSLFWVVSPAGSNVFAGTICLWNISKEKHTAEVGYMLHPEFHNQGLMTDALAQVVQLALDILQFDALIAYTHKDNQASVKLLERRGFERDSTLEALINRDEEPHMVAYKLIKN